MGLKKMLEQPFNLIVMKKNDFNGMGLVELTDLESREICGGGAVDDAFTWARRVGQKARNVWDNMCKAVYDFFEDIGETSANAYYYPI